MFGEFYLRRKADIIMLRNPKTLIFSFYQSPIDFYLKGRVSEREEGHKSRTLNLESGIFI